MTPWRIFALAALALALSGVAAEWWVDPNFLDGDGGFHRLAAVSLLQDGDLDLRNQVDVEALRTKPELRELMVAQRSGYALGQRGEWYPKHAAAYALALLPFEAAFGRWGIFHFNVLLMAGSLALLFGLMAREPKGRLGLAFAFAVVSPTVLTYGYYTTQDILAATAALGGVTLLFQGGKKRAPFAGALFGVAATVKLSCGLFLPFVGAWLIWRRMSRSLPAFCLGAATPLVAFGAWQWWAFGAPWITAYQRVVVLSGDEWTTASHAGALSLPLLPTLLEQHVTGDKPFLLSHPVLWLGVIGIARACRRSPEVALLAALGLVEVLFYGKYTFWSYSWGSNRFLMDTFFFWTACAPRAFPLAARTERTTDEHR